MNKNLVEQFYESIKCKEENQAILSEQIKVLNKLTRKEKLPKKDLRELSKQISKTIELSQRIEKIQRDLSREIISLESHTGGKK